MASEGIRFNNYNVEAQCTPIAFRHPHWAVFGSLGDVHGPFAGAGLAGMAPWEYTIAELLSDAGYATALYRQVAPG